MTAVKEILQLRERVYGSFSMQARIAQNLKFVMRNTNQWGALSPDKQEALEMIMHKCSRILNGDANFLDSWIDIAGYAQLVVDKLSETKP